MANLLSKINIGGVLYDLKDAYAREQIALLLEDAAKHMDSTGIFADDAAVKAYVDAQVGAINSFEVVVADALPAASEDTMFQLYLIADDKAESGTHVEYITVKYVENDEDKYRWEAIGTTAIDLADYVTEDELTEILKAYELKANLKALAYKDSASGTVAGETISGVKATGTGVTGVTLSDNAVEKDVASAGKFTPAGTVSGTAMTAGSIAVTAKYAGTEAVLAKGDYTPAGTVTADFGHESVDAQLVKGTHTPEGEVSVALSGNTFNAITGVGTQASFIEGEFKAATIDKEDVTANYAKEGIVGSVEGETLTFTAAGIEAITATKVNAFNGGSKAADTFVPNSLPTMAEQNVGVQSATFTGTAHEAITGVKYDKAALNGLTFAGTKAENALVTGVTYDKADIDQATFTGATIDLNATFAGTEGDINVAGKYTDTNYSAEANTGAIELAVGDIAVSAKDVTVQ